MLLKILALGPEFHIEKVKLNLELRVFFPSFLIEYTRSSENFSEFGIIFQVISEFQSEG